MTELTVEAIKKNHPGIFTQIKTEGKNEVLAILEQACGGDIKARVEKFVNLGLTPKQIEVARNVFSKQTQVKSGHQYGGSTREKVLSGVAGTSTEIARMKNLL